jgi:hypothetical protein
MPFVLALFYRRQLRLFNFTGHRPPATGHWLPTTVLPSHALRPTPGQIKGRRP